MTPPVLKVSVKVSEDCYYHKVTFLHAYVLQVEAGGGT